MKIITTIFGCSRNQTETKLKVTEKEREDLKYALFILKINQNTQDDEAFNKQSVRAYSLVNELFDSLGIND